MALLNRLLVFDVYDLVERSVDQFVRLVAQQIGHSAIQEHQPEIKVSPEHEHVRVHLDLGQAERGKRMTDSAKAQIDEKTGRRHVRRPGLV